MHGFAKRAGALAVNDAHLEDATFHTSIQVIIYQPMNFAGLERMQVQHAIDGELDWLIHRAKKREGILTDAFSMIK